MQLRDYLHFNRIKLIDFCKQHNFVVGYVGATKTFKKKIGLSMAERIERATGGEVKATKEDWPNLSDEPKKHYYN